MQSSISSNWFEEDDPEMIEISVGISSVGRMKHEIPKPFLDQEFSSDEARRAFLEDQLRSMALDITVEWRDSQ